MVHRYIFIGRLGINKIPKNVFFIGISYTGDFTKHLSSAIEVLIVKKNCKVDILKTYCNKIKTELNIS